MADGQPLSHGVRCFKALAFAAADSRLSRGDLGCLAVILDRFNIQEGAAWPSINRLAKESSISARNVVTCIKRLADLGYLTIDSGSFTRSNRYKPTFKATESGFSTEAEFSTDPEFTKVLKPTSSHLLKPASNKHTHRTSLKNLPSNSTRFADFWQAYPRKVGDKRRAERIWIQKNLDSLADSLISNVKERAAEDGQWENPTFIPHPTTYLNQERWNDEWTRRRARASVSDHFSDKAYQGSADEELPDWARAHA